MTLWHALDRVQHRKAAIPRWMAQRNARLAREAVRLATGPPATDAELADARSHIAKQAAKDWGRDGGLF